MLNEERCKREESESIHEESERRVKEHEEYQILRR